MTATDEQLLSRMQHGDEEAFGCIYKRHASAIKNFAGYMGIPSGSTEDVAQDVFLALIHHARRFDPERGTVISFLFGIARNLVRRVYRDRAVASRGRARLGLPVAAPDEYGEVIERLAAGQTLGSLDEHLAGLPESQRDALELRVVHELDYEEIGQRLAITPEGARTRVFRALATLRSQIGRSA